MKRLLSLVCCFALLFAFGVTVRAATTDVYVSDTTTEWSTNGATDWAPVVATWVHPSWPTIEGATWIWRTAQTNGPDEYATVPEGGWYFQKTFDVPACATGLTGSVSAGADNAYELSINGTVIKDGAMNIDGPDTQAWSAVETEAFTPIVGTNTISIRALNYFSYGPYTSNPAGLIFKATVNYTLGLGTQVDPISGELGVNRWIWNGSGWVTRDPKTKNILPPSNPPYKTYGCSCTQILDLLKAAGLGEFGGHYKFGCSKSVIEDFSKDFKDGKIDGRYLIETVTVPAGSNADTNSTYPLVNGVNYILKAYGVADAQNQTPHIWFDAICANNTTGGSTNWEDYVEGYTSYANLLDLKVNNAFVNWGTCSPTHTYEYGLVGNGSKASFRVYDIYYPNNSGEIKVDIYAQL